MSLRIPYFQLSGDFSGMLVKMSQGLRQGSLGNTILDLVNIRVSQMNGCAFCVDMHVKEARIHGERDLRVHHVAVWRESPLFNDRERAAFEWAETVTKLGEEGVPEDLFQRVRAHFSEKEISDLTFAVGLINFWNRLSVSFRAEPGSADEQFGLTKSGLN